MRTLFVAALGLSWTLQLGAATPPAPLIAVDAAGAWEKTFGPLFALYDDGTVIVRKNWRPGWDAGPSAASYVTLSVPSAEALAQELFPYNTATLKSSYELSSATDQDQTSVWIRGHATRIYGEWDMPKRWADLPPENLRRELEMQQRLPAGLRRLLKKIEALSSSPDSVPWTPESCDIHFCDYNFAPEATTPWPDRWPI
ncbi:MAG TPA: hypothetical protein VK477_07405, partial [Acidobacteriota bacterium]|nr:hypothetical protein [Acidobacteriota bacterium]